MNTWSRITKNPITLNSGTTINLETPIVKRIPASQVSISTITLKQLVDNPSAKTVTAYTNFGNVVLWSGDAYTAIGQWTDEQAQARIIQLFS